MFKLVLIVGGIVSFLMMFVHGMFPQLYSNSLFIFIKSNFVSAYLIYAGFYYIVSSVVKDKSKEISNNSFTEGNCIELDDSYIYVIPKDEA